MTEIDRETYDSSFGPTTGDRIRLADTNLFIEITEDRCVGGDEAVFGGGKSIRESMGQSRATRAEGTPDLVVTGVVVLDHWGVIKADVGIRDGRITALGHAGNPETMDGIHPDLVIGPSTEVMAGNGLIMTAGTVDTHVHYVQPDMLEEALAAGTTTVVGGGTGPTEGSKATLATPGPWWTARMLEAFEPWPVNVLFLARGNTVSHAALWEQLRGGAAGFKVHEDWGATPAAIDAALTVADQSGVQVAIHSDTLNEAGFVEDLLAAVKGRTFHAFHTEGAGGGHAPDIIRIASEPYVLPASTNPTRPVHRQHRGRAPRHGDGRAPPEPAGAQRPGIRREPRPGRAPSPRRMCCRTWVRCRSCPPTPRRWAGSVRWSPAPGRQRTG